MTHVASIFTPKGVRLRLLARRANQCVQKRAYWAAAEHCAQAIALCPNWAVAYATRGNVWILLKEFGRAIEDCDAAISRDPDYALALNNRAIAYSHVNRIDDALADLDAAIRLSPGEALFLANRGALRRRAGNLPGAIDDLQRALRVNPAHRTARVELAHIYVSQAKDDLAFEHLNRAIQLSPSDPTAYKLSGELHARRGNHETAVRYYSHALHRGIPPAATLIERAQSLYELGDFDAALADLSESIKFSPSPEAYVICGSLFTTLGQTARAADDATHALRLIGDSTTNFGQRGLAYLWAGRLDDALADFERMTEREPNNGLHYNNRGYVYHRRGEYERAITDYETAIRLSPELPHSYKNLALLRASCVDQRMRDGAGAIAAAQRALELRKWRQRDWFSILATAYAESGDFTSAQHWLERPAQPPPRMIAHGHVAPSLTTRGPFQFSLGETLLVLTVLAVVLAIRQGFHGLLVTDEFIGLEPLSVCDMPAWPIVFFGALACWRCWRRIRQRPPGQRAFYLGVACAAPLGVWEGLSGIIQFAAHDNQVWRSMPGGLLAMVLVLSAWGVLFWVSLYALLGGGTAAAVAGMGRRLCRLRVAKP